MIYEDDYRMRNWSEMQKRSGKYLNTTYIIMQRLKQFFANGAKEAAKIATGYFIK